MTELDRLDPPPRPPRAPRRRKGAAEKAVLADLEKMPEDLRSSAVAAGALLLARDLDSGGPVSKDSAEHVRKLARLLDDDEITGQQAAGALLMLAAHIERGMASRDRAGHVREMRMNMTQLREWNPGGQEGDRTDKARDQVERTRGLYVVEGEG
jgi:hypothetical protein